MCQNKLTVHYSWDQCHSEGLRMFCLLDKTSWREQKSSFIRVIGDSYMWRTSICNDMPMFFLAIQSFVTHPSNQERRPGATCTWVIGVKEQGKFWSAFKCMISKHAVSFNACTCFKTVRYSGLRYMYLLLHVSLYEYWHVAGSEGVPFSRKQSFLWVIQKWNSFPVPPYHWVVRSWSISLTVTL